MSSKRHGRSSAARCCSIRHHTMRAEQCRKQVRASHDGDIVDESEVSGRLSQLRTGHPWTNQ